MGTRRWLWLLLVAALMGATISVLPALGQTEEVITEDAGLLRLQMSGGVNRLLYDPIVGDNVTQTLGVSGPCTLNDGSENLVAFSANEGSKNPYPGLKDHRIGVGQNGEGNGEPCARINTDLDQALTMELSGTLAGHAIDYAELDLGFKFEGNAVLVLSRNGVEVDRLVVDCTPLSDCGPDSGAADNERVILYADTSDAPATGHWQAFKVDGPFDTLTIDQSDSNAVGTTSLEAGASGLDAGPVGATIPTEDTLFRIVRVFDGEIACGETESHLGGDVESSITRGDDTNGGCKGPEDGLLFTFDSGTTTLGDEEVLFVDFVTEPVDSDATTVAQYFEIIDWTFDAPPAPTEPQHLTLYYDDHVGAGPRPMPWCSFDPTVVVDIGGVMTRVPASPLDPTTVLPTGHTSCLIESRSVVDDEGTWFVTDLVYNIADGLRMR